VKAEKRLSITKLDYGQPGFKNKLLAKVL